MTRRRLLLPVAALSAAGAFTFAVILVLRPTGVPRLRTLGSLAPSTFESPVIAPSATSEPAITTTTAPVAISDPVQVSIARIGLSATVVPVGVEAGTNIVQIPDIDRVGWYRDGPRPGENGSAALVGHVDGQGRPGVFWHLRDLVPGDQITVVYADTSRRQFNVVGRADTAKQDLPAELFSRAGRPRLALITCGGSFDRVTGHYLDNVFVVAVPA